jgi:error-prone DNA polymerase
VAYGNPPVPWSEFERRLSGRGRLDGRPLGTHPANPANPAGPAGRTGAGAGDGPAGDGPAGDGPAGDGGDSPAWSRHRQPYVPPPPASAPRASRVAYAELHCHSNFSFLDGASHPEDLAEEAARLGLDALALTDHDGLYGVVRYAEAASAIGLPTVFGTELTISPAAPRAGGGRSGPHPDPAGAHLVVLARDTDGYARLARTVSEGQLKGGVKGEPVYSLEEVGRLAGGHFVVLTGCRKGAVPSAAVAEGPAAAARELGRLIEIFGRQHVAVELFDHGDPIDSARNDVLAMLAVRERLDLVATNTVHYATPAHRQLAAVVAGVRARCPLDELDGWLPACGAAHLRSGAEQARRFARYPGAVERAAEIGRNCAFDLRLVAPRLPDFPVPDGYSEMGYLRHLVEEGGLRRYGRREAEKVPGAWSQLDHELQMIETLGFAGYFLTVWDIVECCRRLAIYCQGRGSAANSAVCYVLGVTNADAVSLGLLFERFLSPERDGPPDIDVDIESERREEVIQYVYQRYGRQQAAQVANVITYRPRSAVRDVAKAFGHPPGQVDAWCRQIERWGSLAGRRLEDGAGGGVGRGPYQMDGPADGIGIPERVVSFAAELEGAPRHLGIHSGGMVICDRPVVEVCPVEWARMPGRTVLQWDKDDCAAVGLVKFDLLGLGMLEALHRMVDLVAAYDGTTVDLAELRQDPEVYEMLSRADSVGVFQVESRAQMATLPRLKPRCFYDLVVEVALIRPGPIQGGSVHPYIRRRNGQEPVTFLHPLLEPSLRKTLGIPLFQEQLMQMAIDVAGFSAAEADQLRQAMGSKRSAQRMERLRARFYAGMAERGITGEVADAIYDKLAAFANFGFPESHSVSFAFLVYASAWFKFHHPAAFLAALLNSQPMGFWSPQTLSADARRHGVVVLGPDVNASGALATLEVGEGAGPAARLGLSSVRGIGKELAEQVAAGRPYADPEDLAKRAGLGRSNLEALATAGALSCFGISRREALWSAGALAEIAQPGRLPGVVAAAGGTAPALPAMSEVEEVAADLTMLGMSPASSPMEHARHELAERKVLSSGELAGVPHGARVRVGGVVTHRQRPATAGGTTFLNLEDETGLINVICSKGVWTRYRQAARTAAAMIVTGRLERQDGVTNIVAEKLEELDLALAVSRSRDFR